MVEVALTIFKLSGTDRRAGRQTSTSKYRDAMQIQELGILKNEREKIKTGSKSTVEKK